MRASLPILLVLLAPCVAGQPSEVYLDQAPSSRVTGGGLEADVQAIAAGLALSDAAALASVRVHGHHNVAEVYQGLGDGNRVGLALLGDGNAVSLAQLGDGNTFAALILGDGNRVTGALQMGEGNSYVLALEGDFHAEHTVLQLGGGNSAVQVVGAGSSPVSVVQFGAAEAVIFRR